MLSRRPDYTLIIVSFLLTIFGLIILASASAPVAFNKFGDSFHYLKHQLFYGFIPGIITFFIFSRIDYRIWKGFGWGWFFLSIFLLGLVFIPGIGAEFSSSKSWIKIGGLFSMQPAEVVKLTFLLFLAFWLEQVENKGIFMSWKKRFIQFCGFLGIIIGLLILQPDVGTAVIFLTVAFLVYFVYGANWQELSIFAGGAILGFFTMIKLAPYRTARILTFLNPELDPQGAGYQINQAILAVGSGGFFGRGLGSSRQKFQYLPEVASDSIFAIIGEELGFIFSIIIIFLFLSFAMKTLALSRRAPDSFAKFLSIGILAWITFQALINIGGIIGIMPLTGLPLPFISYGGTAMVSVFAALGILINISKYAKT